MKDQNQLHKKYEKDGFVFPVQVISSEEAIIHRQILEDAERKIGPLHYKTKIHTILTSPYKLATNSLILDLVEKIIGPNILLHNVTYIIKEANSLSHVSWHQDLTYWGFSHDDQVSVWLALSSVNKQNGAMKMIPGSHKRGMMKHKVTKDKNNVLFQGQTVERVNENKAILCELLPGQASFHHRWTLHSSSANRTSDRRIGLNIQYLATHVKQTKNNLDSSICVRGEDKYNNFNLDKPARLDLDRTALEKQNILNELYRKTAASSN